MAELRTRRAGAADRPRSSGPAGITARPKTPAGIRPEPNPGQTELGTGYTVLRGGQDVQQPGYYFDVARPEVRYWEPGQTLAHARQGDHWLYLTDDRDASRAGLGPPDPER